MANKRREDYIKRNNTIVMIVLGIVLVAIFLSSNDFGKELLASFTGGAGESSQTQVINEIKPETTADGKLMSVHYIDVGQGDSELIRIPNSNGEYFNMLIDCGIASMSDEVISYIKELGVTKLDAVVVTHPHADHMGGMADIINEFEIDKFYMPRFSDSLTPTTVSYEKMLDALTEKGLGITVLKAGIVIPTTDTAVASVLSPKENAEYEDINNFSAIIKITFGEKSFLFMGDAETESFTDTINSGYDMTADVLKVGHHGSSNATDKTLLDAVKPSIAVISLGVDNTYGHPHNEVIDLLAGNNIKILRTDELGTIIIETDGENIIE